MHATAAALVLALAPAATASTQTVTEISQYGITWHFAEPVEAGQFVTGDWWVLGPVTVEAVDPAPQTKPGGQFVHGSMVDPVPGPGQAYDSRAHSFDEDLVVEYPLQLEGQPTTSLVSTIAYEPDDPEQLRPNLSDAAVLTVLAQPPPDDAFRPGLVAGEKTIYRQRDINWDRLPALEPAGSVPSAEQIDDEWTPRFKRPWLVHGHVWAGEEQLAPINNMENYHQYIAIELMTGAVLLVTDYGDRTNLMRHYLQVGIDYAAVSLNNEGGTAIRGTYAWPIIFTGLMLGDENVRDVFIDGRNSTPDYHTLRQRLYFYEDRPDEHPESEHIPQGETWTFWHTNTGRPAIFWSSNDQLRPDEPDWNGTSETYRFMHSVAVPGFTLAARAIGELDLLEQGHHSPGAYSAYADRWMTETREHLEFYGLSEGHASVHPVRSTLGALRNDHEFIDDMWFKHRPQFEPAPPGLE